MDPLTPDDYGGDVAAVGREAALGAIDERLQQWWGELSDEHRAGLLAADLDRPLPVDLVDVVTRARVVAPAIRSWWEKEDEATIWLATSRVTAFVGSKRAE